MACPYRKLVRRGTWTSGDKFSCVLYTKKFSNDKIDYQFNMKYCAYNNATNSKCCPIFKY